jgi:hypothetical protein
MLSYLLFTNQWQLYENRWLYPSDAFRQLPSISYMLQDDDQITFNQPTRMLYFFLFLLIRSWAFTRLWRKKKNVHTLYKHVHYSVAKHKESTIGVSKILKLVVFRSWKLQLIILFCSHRRWLYRSSAIEHSSYRLLVLFSSILDDISVDLFTLVNCFLCALLCENLTFLFFFLLYNHSNSLMSTFMTFYSSYFN